MSLSSANHKTGRKWLSATGQVCRYWAPICRAKLFSYLTLQSSGDLDDLVALYTRSPIPITGNIAHEPHISIRATPMLASGDHPWLHRLLSLSTMRQREMSTSVHIDGSHLRAKDTRIPFHTIHLYLPRIPPSALSFFESLTLENVRFSGITELRRLLSGVQCERVQLSDLIWDSIPCADTLLLAPWKPEPYMDNLVIQGNNKSAQSPIWFIPPFVQRSRYSSRARGLFHSPRAIPCMFWTAAEYSSLREAITAHWHRQEKAPHRWTVAFNTLDNGNNCTCCITAHIHLQLRSQYLDTNADSELKFEFHQDDDELQFSLRLQFRLEYIGQEIDMNISAFTLRCDAPIRSTSGYSAGLDVMMHAAANLPRLEYAICSKNSGAFYVAVPQMIHVNCSHGLGRLAWEVFIYEHDDWTPLFVDALSSQPRLCHVTVHCKDIARASELIRPILPATQRLHNTCTLLWAFESDDYKHIQCRYKLIFQVSRKLCPRCTTKLSLTHVLITAARL